eukprot:PhM_4_TR7341/c0_g1_i1/m.18499/K02328/POLD2; DNA polymerase delta subunit 2
MSQRKIFTDKELVFTGHEGFRLRDLHFTQQYSHLYYHRLEHIRDVLEDSALEAFFPPGDNNVATTLPRVVRVLNMTPGERVVTTGCVYKEMVAKPSFLADYTKQVLTNIEVEVEDDAEVDTDDAVPKTSTTSATNHNASSASQLDGTGAGRYVRDTDYLILEDESGRTPLEGGPGVATTPTGVMLAVLGALNAAGKFVVEKYYFLDAIRSKACAARRRELVPVASSAPSYVAFISGVGLGVRNGHVMNRQDSLLRFMRGTLGHRDLALAIRHVVIAGNLILTGNAANTLLGSENNEEGNNENIVPTAPSGMELSDSTRIRLDVDETRARRDMTASALAQADEWLSELLTTTSVTLMPGECDPTNVFLPQQPVHPVVLRKSATSPVLRLATNPHSFEIHEDGNNSFISVFGTSGQNLDDIQHQCSGIDDVTVLENLLRGMHACPTAPDTLSSFPFTTMDPYLLAHDRTTKTLPHLFFSGTRRQFATRVLEGVDGGFGARVLCVPNFFSTGMVVLVDVSSPTLEHHVVELK